MHTLLLLTISFTLLAEAASAGDRDRDLRCEEIKQEIRKIHSRMRSGYTRAQGEKLEERLRKLRALRAKACR